MKKELEPFYRALHRRGETLQSLAAGLGTTHGHLSQVFAGKRGKHTRKHIVRHLTASEAKLLGWEPVDGMVAEPDPLARAKEIYAAATKGHERAMSQVEHSST